MRSFNMKTKISIPIFSSALIQKEQVELVIISNTIDEKGNPINSSEINQLAERAYKSELNIYNIDPATFGLDAFNKAFLGNNKLSSLPSDYPKLPYRPDDILMFRNSIMVFSHNQQDIGYFSILCFLQKEDKDITNIHLRFMAGFEPEWRGKGFFYLPLINQVFNMVIEFKEKFPNDNPLVNITQFAMVSAGTPGAIINFVNLLKRFHPHVPEFKFGDTIATNMGVMMGLGKLINPENGIADINMEVKNKTLKPNNHNEGAKKYQSLGIKDGSGITGRQELLPLNSLINVLIESGLLRDSNGIGGANQNNKMIAKL